MATKKMFVELVSFLEQNKDKKISDILETVKDMTMAQKQASTVIKDKDGNITHVFCYYHKQWENIKEVEYGKKKSHHTGLNTMCKIGVNKWTKQQAVAAKAKAALLEEVAEGNVKPQDIQIKLDEIENNRNKIDMKDAPQGTKEAPKA